MLRALLAYQLKLPQKGKSMLKRVLMGLGCVAVIFGSVPTYAQSQEQREYYIFGTALTQIYRMEMSDALSFAGSSIPEDYRQLPDLAPESDKDKINGVLGLGARFGNTWAAEIGYYTGISAESQVLPSLTPRELRDNGLMQLDFDYVELAALRYIKISNRVRVFGRAGAQVVQADVWYRDDARQRSYSDEDETRNFRRSSKTSLEGVAGAGIEIGFNSALGARFGYNLSSMGWRQGYLHFYYNF